MKSESESWKIKSALREAMSELHHSWHRFQEALRRGLPGTESARLYLEAQKAWKVACSLPGCDRRIKRSVVKHYYNHLRRLQWDVEYPKTPAPALRQVLVSG